jgi:hypothetical protein
MGTAISPPATGDRVQLEGVLPKSRSGGASVLASREFPRNEAAREDARPTGRLWDWICATRPQVAPPATILPTGFLSVSFVWFVYFVVNPRISSNSVIHKSGAAG